MLNLPPFLLNAGQTIFLIGISLSVAVPSSFSQVGNTPAAKDASDGDVVVHPGLAFDVVSIRASNAGPDESRLQVVPGGDRYEAIGLPLGWTILMAYVSMVPISKDRIVGAPAWVWDDNYDVVGKVGEADMADWRKISQRGLRLQNPMAQTMLQNALADRCKLAVHRVATLIDGYALVVANHGPNRKNLVESKPDDAIPERAEKVDLDARIVRIHSPDDPVVHFYQTSMAAFVLFLSGAASVEDRTGLPGKYKFDFRLIGFEGIPVSDWDLAPLGLKLIPAKIPSENIVIDHIERPSPN
ncbi:TIGR03435 family protein [Telmatobacter sp. DSM 110680]|uniref:TIGR03435 family protein n=1 Tax=Telmatobacter sp. DSM 110680 TaxID=3036704 RepID=A0AAU7DNQ7_9BACT